MLRKNRSSCKVEDKTEKKVKKEVKRQTKRQEKEVIKVDFDHLDNSDDISQEQSKEQPVVMTYHCLPNSKRRPSTLVRQPKSVSTIRKKIKKTTRVKMQDSFVYELDEKQDKPTFVISNVEPDGDSMAVENFELQMGEKKYLFASW